jgi:hypothetical protein
MPKSRHYSSGTIRAGRTNLLGVLPDPPIWYCDYNLLLTLRGELADTLFNREPFPLLHCAVPPTMTITSIYFGVGQLGLYASISSFPRYESLDRRRRIHCLVSYVGPLLELAWDPNDGNAIVRNIPPT